MTEGKKSIKNYSKEIKKESQNEKEKETKVFTMRLTKKERDRMRALARACGISQTQLIKKLIGGAELKAIPPEEFYQINDCLSNLSDEILLRYNNQASAMKELNLLKDGMSCFADSCKLFYDEGIFGSAYRKSQSDFYEEMDRRREMFGEDN